MFMSACTSPFEYIYSATNPGCSPYLAGNIVHLHTSGWKRPPQPDWAPSTVKARIIRPIRPFTSSCILQVVLLTSDDASNAHLPSEQPFILKLYDRRFASNTREQRKLAQWTPEREEALVTFVRSGQLEAFLATVDEWSLATRDDLDEAQKETVIAHYYRELPVSEIAAYELLQELQGDDIPVLYADVRLDFVKTASGNLSSSREETKNEFLEIKGILIEYIPGFILEDVETQAPESAWPSICEQAVSTVNKIGDYGVLNKDVRPTNVIVRAKHCREESRSEQEEQTTGYDIIVIDFALCDFRKNWGTEEEWRAAKHTQDEEGAIGYVMEGKLRRFKKGKKRKWKGPLPWMYKPSWRYLEQSGNAGAPGEREQEERNEGNGALVNLDVVAD